MPVQPGKRTSVERRLRSISGAQVSLDFSHFKWSFDGNGGTIIKQFTSALPREVWLVGDGPGAQYVVLTYRLPDGDEIPDAIKRAQSYFPGLPPDEVLWALEDMSLEPLAPEEPKRAKGPQKDGHAHRPHHQRNTRPPRS